MYTIIQLRSNKCITYKMNKIEYLHVDNSSSSTIQRI